MVDEPGSTVPFFGILYRVLQILGMMGLFIYFQNDLKGHKTIAQCFTSKKTAHPSSINWFRHCDFSIYVHVRNLNYYSVNQFWGSDCWIQVLAISPADSCVPFSE